MNKASIALGALATVIAAGYLANAEWQLWDKFTRGQFTRGSKADSEQGSGQATRSPRARGQDPEKPETPGQSETPETPAAGATTASTSSGGGRRQGTTVYWVDKRCDCPQNYALMLEAVTIDETSTTLTLLNARDNGQSTYPPGHDDALFLLESRFVNNDRPRHELKATRGIGHYPEWSTDRVMELVFPRVHDEAETIRLIGNSTANLMTLDFTGIELKNQMPTEEWRRFQSYKTCGFDGPSTIPAGQSVTFQAHVHPGASGHEWSGKQGLKVTGDGQSATVRGQGPGKGELCLTSKVAGDRCTSCQPIEVVDSSDDQGAAKVPDFRLQGCAGFPSRPPNWRFEVVDPDRDTTYAWSVTGRATIIRDSQKKNPVIVKPNLHPGRFTVTLEATDSSGRKASLSREVHNVYSCPE